MIENVDVTIDFSGVPCPAPVLGAKKILNDLQFGQTLCLISDCSGAHNDLASWCQYTRNVLVSATKQGNGKTHYLIFKSGKEETLPAPHITLDMRGVSCPGPIVEAKKLLEGMKAGEVLQLITDCTAAIDEVPLWSRSTSIEFLIALELSSGAQEFYLKKGQNH